MCRLRIDNKTISTPLVDIIKDVRRILNNGKLRVIKLKGDDITVTCPNPDHAGGQEEHADCHIFCGEDSEKLKFGTFHCFACGVRGDFVKFISLCFESTEAWAKEWLIDTYCDGIIEDEVEVADAIVLNTAAISKEIDESIINSMESWHPYMAQRKISKPIAERFEVKYEPASKCIVFPVRDEYGKLIGLTKRSTIEKKFIIPPGMDKPPYLLYYMKKNNIDTCIITEGQIDALVANSYGFPAIATMGALSDKQMAILNKSPIRTYLTMFDNDEAGRKFTQDFNKKIRKDVFVINLRIPYGFKDIGDLDEKTFWKILNSEGFIKD